MNESELQVSYVNDGADFSGPPCPPAYRDLAQEIVKLAPVAPGSIDTDIGAFANLEPAQPDIWNFEPEPGYSSRYAQPIDYDGV